MRNSGYSCEAPAAARLGGTAGASVFILIRAYGGLFFGFKHARESSEPDAVKNFRLSLKGKIAVKYADWIQDCNTIEERRNMIDEIYKEHERDYTELLKALEKRTKH